jgi:2-polyprenyl-3-methyl-5-hydroxy-6-metoxy-1,4-benzoquinol methylase
LLVSDKPINKNITKHDEAGRECIACHGADFSEYGSQLVRCQNCGLIVAKHIPGEDELAKLYTKDYFFGMEYSDYQADRLALEQNFRQRIRFLRPYITPKSKMAEVGCAYGYFLNLMKDDVEWQKGFDVSKEAVAYAKDELHVNAYSSDFLDDTEIKPGSLDLVCMWDVVEHLGEPDKYLKKASEVLKTGGAVSLTTGDISAAVPRFRGAKWRMIHPPTHIYYFTPASIEKLLRQYSLKVVAVRHKSTYRNAGSVFNQLICNRKARNKGAGFLEFGYAIAKAVKLDRLNIPLNLYDVMEVTAVKQ